MTALNKVAPLPPTAQGEADVESHIVAKLRSRALGYDVKPRKCGIKTIDRHWPSKNTQLPSGEKTRTGAPDLLLCLPGSKRPVCVWENKARTVPATDALGDAQFYVRHLHSALAAEPALPRVAAGFNGEELLLSYYNYEGNWVDIKYHGNKLKDEFPGAAYLANGISSIGVLSSASGSATAQDLRTALWQLKTAYRIIPPLTADQGRVPIDFTVALLTVRLLVEQHPDWGTWAEQPNLQTGAASLEQKIAERFKVLTDKILSDHDLKDRYGDILRFKEKEGGGERAFDFLKVLDQINRDRDHFSKLFLAIDSLPPLLHADFDIFGEVYQYIGDEATKKALGEFFTGRHIISGFLPVFFARSGYNASFNAVRNKRIADVACGTGGFLTETLRLLRRIYKLKDSVAKAFAQRAFYGYDLGNTNASRARVNMYFAGDGFCAIEGGVDSLSTHFLEHTPKGGFDAVLTNPPYGQSSYGRSEEAFLRRAIQVLKKGQGWALLVLPTGVLENPRSAKTRFHWLKHAMITDIVTLPKHAFAPYTQQKTAIAIFRKRTKPVDAADGDWNALREAVGNEMLSLYIVDNDGYANSDKRYATDRKADDGRWLHNELAEWTSNDGMLRKSALYEALIEKLTPVCHTDEFGEDLGRKYLELRLRSAFNDTAGIVLLPDNYLRVDEAPVTMDDYASRCSRVIAFRKGLNSDFEEGQYGAEVKSLLAARVIYGKNVHLVQVELKDLFIVEKGDQGLTEEAIYKSFDPDGPKVYGGGASVPRFRISKSAMTKRDTPVTLFSGPVIVVSMDGTAGSMRVVEDAEFCLNHHGCVLRPYSTSIDLHWFIQQCEASLRSHAVNREGSATLTMDKLKHLQVEVPVPKSLRERVGRLRAELVRIKQNLLLPSRESSA